MFDSRISNRSVAAVPVEELVRSRNMASSGTIVRMIYAFGITVGFADSSLMMECDKTKMGHFGQQTLLNCVIKQQDVEVRVVSWRKLGLEDPLLFFQETLKTPVNGFRFADPSRSPKNMNVSLLIDNTKVEDEGEYECLVVTTGGEGMITTHLNVKAKYSQPTIKETEETQVLNAERTLICESFGGYPEGKLRWFDVDDKDWTKSSNTTITKMDSGLFKISSRLPLLSGSALEKCSCKVYDSNGAEENEVSYEISKSSFRGEIRRPSTTPPMDPNGDGPNETKVIAPLVVIGSLIVGLLLVLLYRRRNQKMRRPSTAPLMGHHEHVETQDPDVETGDPEDDAQ
ncbi:hypothetical protein OJAV_G00008480 [Oryzias javanicus]|uniref:Ig-like domain-containing protein n=1 Tax=Oryzias javanicus TaxID=123683 RepID=A0A3S2UQX3_ORYJA|nr:hypothetical protein OJAV_G00008480 [Oryzias javanicus]